MQDVAPASDVSPASHVRHDVQPEVPELGTGAYVLGGHGAQVSGSTRNSPPPHCAQSLRTEPPLLVNMLSVLTPERSRFQQIVLSKEEAP